VFSDVDIVAEKGPFLLGTNQGNISVDSDVSYAISSIISLYVEEIGDIQFLVSLTNSRINTQFNGKSAYFVSKYNNSDIYVKDKSGNRIWSGNSTNNIFYIEDEDFYFLQDSSLYLFPIISRESIESTKLTITPSNSKYKDLLSLLDGVTEVASDFVDISEISDNIQSFESILSTAYSVVNGGMILVDTDDIFNVDGSSQSFTKIGFARGNKFDVSISKNTNTTKIDGDYKLIFLGDYLYTSQAKESKDGVAFPFIILLIWIIAIIIFILFKFFFKIIKPILFKEEVDQKLNEKIKKYALIFHIAALIIAFILLDREISFQFGMSAIDALIGQGFSLVLLGFVIIELIMWVIGYFALDIPIRIFTNSILRIFGIGKGGKGIGGGVGAFGIWIFCIFFVKLIINIFLLFLNPSNLFRV